MKIIASVLTVACLLCFFGIIFTSCNSTESQITDNSDSDDIVADTSENTVGALPQGTPAVSYTTADGYFMKQYNELTENDYTLAVNYFLSKNYTTYSSSEIGGFLSTTLLGESNYQTVSFNASRKELYIGTSAKNAVLPSKESFGEKCCDISVTQCKSSEQNGMSYVVRLSDGSFIAVDGGYADGAEELYKTLCTLNGSSDNIHVRAWILTHSHSDHYTAFGEFSKKYADKTTLDYVMYSPVKNVPNCDKYLTDTLKNDIQSFKGAKLCGVHTGMSFDFGELTLEILISPEQLYKATAPDDFNETSAVFRITSSNGSMIFLADSGINAANWLIEAYGDALKSDMVQISHHGCETTPSELYDKIEAAVCFWPCDESLFNTSRGEPVKQHIINAEYSKEHLLHSYGTVTRLLSYKATAPEYLNILPQNTENISSSNYADNVRIEDGVLKFEVKSANGIIDPYIYFDLDNISTSDYNAIKIIASTNACKASSVFFKCGADTKFSAEKEQKLGITGAASSSEKATLIGYLGDIDGYTGNLTSIRIDLGSTDNETVEIYSVELFKINL